MMANVPWKAMNSRCGIVPCASRPTPRSPAKANEPTTGAARREGQRVADAAPTPPPPGPSATKLIIIVLSAFFDRTMPP